MSEYRTMGTLTPAYDITLTTVKGTVVYTGRTRREAAMYKTVARHCDDVSVTLTRRWHYSEYEVAVCAGCLARPSLAEMDCDGWYDTVNCGVCDWWAAWDLHYGTTSI